MEENAPQVVTRGLKHLTRPRPLGTARATPLENFTARVSGDDVGELDRFRLLEASEFVLAEREDFVPGQSRVGFHHNGERGFAPLRTVLTDNTGFTDAWMALQDTFNFSGVKILSA